MKKVSKASDGPKYRVLKKLAEGGMAEVFLAERRLPGKRPEKVVLKRVLPRLRHDPAMNGMLEDEIVLGRRCTHPNVIATYDAGVADGFPYAVLEYVDGMDLSTFRQVLDARGQVFSRAEAVEVGLQITAGLRYLHELKDEHGHPLGIVHRDVTPPNVLISRRGEVKLCDFGFVRSTQQRTRTEPGLIKGKFSYLSPEAAHGEIIEPRSDLFSVGIILWEMLTMQRLFHGKTDYDTVKLIQDPKVPSLAAVGADVDDVLEELVLKALARDPDERFPSAEALHNSLAAYQDYADLECDLGGRVREAVNFRESRTNKRGRLRARTSGRTQINV